MKKRWVAVSSILALALVHATGQTSSGGGGGSTGGGASTTTSGGGTTTSSSTSTSGGVQNNRIVNQNPNLPPGVQNREQLPPGSQNRQPLQPTLGIATNRMGFTNQPSFTNRFAGGTNRFGSDTNLSPTGRFGTNHFASTNNFSFTNFNSSTFRDEAGTPADRPLLVQIKQTIITQISIGGGGHRHWFPIHCHVHNGRASLMGLVANAEQAQQIQSVVSQIPGVVGVESGLTTLPADRATTAQDRTILTQIRQMIPLSQPSAPWTPVSFNVNQGVVGIAGIVPSTQESQQIETTVRQVPGVVQTSNTLIVDAMGTGNVNASPALTVPQQ